MKLRQRIESYYAVWTFNERLGDGHWEPLDEGITTRKAAEKYKREAEEQYPDERFCIVRTMNERIEGTATPKRSETKP